MPGRDIIGMSVKELKRLKLVHEAMEKHITQKIAAELLEISERHMRRLIRVVRKKGGRGVIHRSRGRLSNSRISDKVKEKAVRAYKESYQGFGPTLASEKLLEREGIAVISMETMREWLLDEGLWNLKRKMPKHRSRRERKECFGEMVQMEAVVTPGLKTGDRSLC